MFDVAMYCGSYGLLFTLGLTLGRTRTERTASSGDAAAGVDGGGMWRRVPMPDWLAARYERCPVIYSHYAVANPHNACVSASLALEIEDRRCRECPRVTDLFFEEEVRSEEKAKGQCWKEYPSRRGFFLSRARSPGFAFRASPA